MRFIDIEGTDGCGKATQTKLLYEYLMSKGYSCKIVSFPNYSSRSSEPVKMYLSGELGADASCLDGYQTSAIFAVDRLCTMHKEDFTGIDYVLFDRYTPSNMIHQSTRIEDMAELDRFLDWLEDFEYNNLKLPRPDKILFLDVPPEISIKLAHERETLKNGETVDILEADNSHLYKAYDRAKFVSHKYNWLHIDCTEVGRLKSIDEIHKEILKQLNI